MLPLMPPEQEARTVVPEWFWGLLAIAVLVIAAAVGWAAWSYSQSVCNSTYGEVTNNISEVRPACIPRR